MNEIEENIQKLNDDLLDAYASIHEKGGITPGAVTYKYEARGIDTAWVAPSGGWGEPELSLALTGGLVEE